MVPCSLAAAVSRSMTSSRTAGQATRSARRRTAQRRLADQAAGRARRAGPARRTAPRTGAARARPGRAGRTTSWPPSSPGRGGCRTAAGAGRRSLPRSARGRAGRTGRRTRTGPGAARCAGRRSGCRAAARRTRPRPRSGTRMPARQCSSVDLPDPLGPMTARISPAPHPQRGAAQRGRLPERLDDVPRLDDLLRCARAPCGRLTAAGHRHRTAPASMSSRAAVWSIQRRSASSR